MQTQKILETCKKIHIHGINNLGKQEIFKSLIDEILSDNKIIILAPTLNSRLVKLNTREIYDIIFFCKDSPYSCKAKIDKYIIKDNLNCTKVTLLSSLSKFQRRESYRLECTNTSINFNVVNENEENEITNENGIIDDENLDLPFKGTVKNISAGGIKFNSNQKLELENIIKILITFPDKKTLITNGKILFTEELDLIEKHKYSYKVCFTNISVADKKFLEKYLFDEQLKIIRKNSPR